MKVLVVDDSKAMRMIVIRTLKQAGWDDAEFVEATNGAEGLAAAASQSPDLILSDWNMPEMNGMDFLTELRASGHAAKFGFVTAEGTPEMREQALDAGALFLITKPFTATAFQVVLPLVTA